MPDSLQNEGIWGGGRHELEKEFNIDFLLSKFGTLRFTPFNLPVSSDYSEGLLEKCILKERDDVIRWGGGQMQELPDGAASACA